MLCADPMLYDLLGDGKEKKRATLADLCSSSASPIAKAQNRVVDRLEGWGVDGPCWLLLTCVGGSPGDVRAALMAKSELLLLSAAIVDHFELRMSHPPYTLIRLLDPDLPLADQRRCAQSFLRAPEHCLSLFCRRLRQRCPSVRLLLSHGREIIEAWATSCFVGIDHTERSHGQLRQNLRSSTRARSFTRGANYMVCQELRSAHIQKGGRDPAVLDASSCGTATASAEGATPGAASTKRPSGGHTANPYLFFRNQKLASRKKVVASDRKLTQEELDGIEVACRSEWEGMDRAERANWERLYAAQQLANVVFRQEGRLLRVQILWCFRHGVASAQLTGPYRSRKLLAM